MPKKRITDTQLKALKPALKGQRYSLMDMEIPGFGVRVTDTGARTFIYRTRYPGSTSPNRRSLGEYPAMSLADAREKARDWRTLVKRGIDPADLEKQQRLAEEQRRANTFAAVAEDFFTEKLSAERKGREVERDIRREFLPAWGERPITAISDIDILTIVRAKKRTAPAQARNLLTLAKRMFAWAVDARVYGLTDNPCEGLKPGRVVGEKRSRNRILTDDELFSLWRAATKASYPFGPVYQLLILSALRLNEAADAAWTEFDPLVVKALRDRGNGETVDWNSIPLDRRIWTIPAARMKGREEKARAHVVPITSAIGRLLETLPVLKRGPFLFSTTMGEKPAWMSSKAKERIDGNMLRTLRALSRRRGGDSQSVKLAPWVNHDLRHTVRTRLSRLKISEEAREAVLAHVRSGIVGVYDHHDYLDEKFEALELWAARLKSIVASAPVNIVPIRVAQ